MHKFKNNVSDGWLFKQELRLFKNFASNWKREVDDSDFFDIFSNSNNSDSEEAVEFFTANFTREELKPIDGIRIEDDGTAKVRLRAHNNGRWNGRPSIRGSIDGVIRDIWNTKKLRSRCRKMLFDWSDAMEAKKSKTCKKSDPLAERFDEVCSVLKLNDYEREVFLYAIVRRMTCFDDFPVGCTNGRHDRHIYIAMATDSPVSQVEKALKEKAKLRRYDVLDNDGDIARGSAIYDYLESGGKNMLEGQFYKQAKTKDALPWEYYGTLKDKHGDILKDIIASARGKHGVNILLYGAPGTGKTSFTKTLAKELGLDLYEIRQGDRDGDRNKPESRLAGIQICNDQVPRERSMMMVDEADQLLRTSFDFFSMFFGFGGSSASSEKGVINSILDKVKIPTVWISNAPARTMDDSVRRRFDYSICFEKLTNAQRRSIWRNNVEKLHLEKVVGEDLVDKMSGKYSVSAGGITMVLENLKRMKPRKDRVEGVIEKLMEPHCKLMDAKSGDDLMMPSKDYSLDGLNMTGEVPLERIGGAVRNFRDEADTVCKDPDRPRMNMLLWGPPGTGKTEFVKYLGKALNMKVLCKMGSDLLSMWVGETEQNIKRAFREAEEEGAILFLDEIDGIVQDRTGASKSWEVTQVNELLYQMENFKGVMVAATNFMDNLDQAIMRRFTFKMQFDYLKDEGKKLFFERLFKTPLTDEEATRLYAIRNLAPGDFRTVRQSMYYLGGETTNAQRLSELEKESSVKKDTKKAGRIGFGG